MTETKFIIESDGRELSTIIYETGSSEKCVIMCHGFPGDKLEHGRFSEAAKALNRIGIDVIAFDYSGFGDNKREPVLISRNVKNLEDVYAWVKKRGYKDIGTTGLSMGGLVSLLANLPERKVAVFWAPGFSMSNFSEGFLVKLMKKRLQKKPRKIWSAGENKEKILIDIEFLEESKSQDISSNLGNFSIPTLIIQGTRDPVVKPKDTKEAFEKMPQDEHHEIIFVEKAGHAPNGEKLTQFVDNSVEWFKKYL
ncbi:MAG: alpha/beta hydrolase [archaeon]|nr:alpha/beta hydrolase [archaeon]